EYRYRHQLNLNSLPTRRSSDLVDIMEGLKWLKNGTELLWLSERDGWRHAYSIPLDGRAARLITPGDFDVISVTGADPSGQWLYRSEEHTSELQSRFDLVCRLLL